MEARMDVANPAVTLELKVKGICDRMIARNGTADRRVPPITVNTKVNPTRAKP